MSTAFFFSSRRRHTRYWRDWSSDVCCSDLGQRRRHHRGLCLGHHTAHARDAADPYVPLERPVLPIKRLCELAREREKIGRAPCRERGEISVVAVSLKKTQCIIAGGRASS